MDQNGRVLGIPLTQRRNLGGESSRRHDTQSYFPALNFVDISAK